MWEQEQNASCSEMTPRTGAPTNVFRHAGEFWTVVYDGRLCHLGDTAGMRILAILLSRPGEPVESSELVAWGKNGARASERQAAERARVRATRAIKAALQKLEMKLPSLAAHFTATVRTGRRCVYQPDRRTAIDWEIAMSPPNPPASQPRTGR